MAHRVSTRVSAVASGNGTVDPFLVLRHLGLEDVGPDIDLHRPGPGILRQQLLGRLGDIGGSAGIREKLPENRLLF